MLLGKAREGMGGWPLLLHATDVPWLLCCCFPALAGTAGLEIDRRLRRGVCEGLGLRGVKGNNSRSDKASVGKELNTSGQIMSEFRGMSLLLTVEQDLAEHSSLVAQGPELFFTNDVA